MTKQDIIFFEGMISTFSTYNSFLKELSINADSSPDEIIPAAKKLALAHGIGGEDVDDVVASWYVTGKWLCNKSFYRFDTNFCKALNDTEDSPVHVDVLRHLPYNTVCISGFESAIPNPRGYQYLIANFTVDSSEVGVFIAAGRIFPDGVRYQRFNIWIPDGESLTDTIDRYFHRISSSAEQSLLEKNMEERENWAVYDGIGRFAILAAYYLSSKNAELEVVYTKKGHRPTIAGKRFAPQEWDVGYRIGSTYEHMTERTRPEDSATELPASESNRNSPRPHMRRAHWHHYWTGQGRTNYEARWIPPIAVNTKDIGTQIPVVQHDVKGSEQK